MVNYTHRMGFMATLPYPPSYRGKSAPQPPAELPTSQRSLRRGWLSGLWRGLRARLLKPMGQVRPTTSQTEVARNLPPSLNRRSAFKLGSARTLDLRHHQADAPLQFRQSRYRYIQQQALRPTPQLTPPPQARLTQRSGRFPRWRLSSYWGATGILAVILLIVGGGLLAQNLTSSFRQVYADALSGQDHLVLAEAALREANFTKAQAEFLQAQQSFEVAMDTLSRQEPLTLVPGIGERLSAGQILVKAGQTIATSGYQLTTSMEPITDLLKGRDSNQVDADTPLADYTSQLTTTLALNRSQLKLAHDRLARTEAELATIDESLLDDYYRQQLILSRQKIRQLVDLLDQTYELSGFLPSVLGVNTPRNYLILFQNNAELRPTGGFIGSFGVVSFADGKLGNFFADNAYNPDGQIGVKGMCELPPASFRKYVKTDCWGMRDANWSPDFPTSAREIARLYQQGSDQSIDGVIAITPDIIREVLKHTGPVSLYRWNEVVSAENVIPLIQYKVSVEFRDTENPKLFLVDLAQVVFERLLSMTPEQWTQLSITAREGLADKSIQLYPFEPEAARFVQEHQIAGDILPPEHDYLMINNANVGATKASPYLQQSYTLDTEIQADGSLINELTITYTHNGSWDWPGGQIMNYQRIYVPQGSELLSASESDTMEGKLSLTDVYDEFEHTVFADYVRIIPHATVTVSYRYRIPTRIDPSAQSAYSLMVQRQPGTQDISLTQNITFDGYALDPLQGSSSFELLSEDHLINRLTIDRDQTARVTFVPHRVL